MSDDLVKREYLIHKSGRGWYRENSQGYTPFKYDAGRYTEAEAKAISHPNGEGGPRDGMLYRHESMVRDAPSDHIEALTAKLAEVEAARDEWRSDFRALEKAIVGDTGLSAMTVATQATLFRPRAEAAEAREREAYARGFKAALEEAAKKAERHFIGAESVARHIRATPVPDK